MSHRVVVLRRAEEELTAIALWLASRSRDGAVRWLDAFERAKDSLAVDPYCGESAPESEFVEAEVRQILFKTRSGNRYRALYTIDGNDVRVLHIRGPGQPIVPPDEF